MRATTPPGAHRAEPHDASVASRLNALRAAVLGANDGIVSTAGLVVGVSGATGDRGTLVVAGLAGLVAGAMSMAAGEYVSVSTQRDTERALIAKEARELEEMPEAELDELTGLYQAKGLSPELARKVAVELTETAPLRSHLDAELGIDPDDLTNPWHAAFASMASFIVGALLPLLAIAFIPGDLRTPLTVVSVAIALAGTGYVAARAGGSPPGRAVVRNVGGGLLAMGITYGIGSLVGTTGVV
ncbi:VIT family protein [Nocardioides marmotae]|uniref:VIT1/CCC1 transporter family protein n=1 Tax=Nocardioides marmotae TaxID=2663857 RepID=UPI0013244729|nr:VIT family protein [Nocardioides marmotae]MBC9732525.1 VIT family protein [Nocardioides marmotae]MTB83644.1 VIT family protein [Nocardioides marmotae]